MFTLLRLVAQLLVTLSGYAKDRQLLSAGEQEAIGKMAKEAHDALVVATQAREEQRARNAAVPRSDSLPDDGWRRD